MCGENLINNGDNVSFEVSKDCDHFKNFSSIYFVFTGYIQ